MKEIQGIDAFRNIKKELASFLSIAVIAMLAVCVYLGISFSASAMDRNVSDYYHERNIQDLQVISPLLLSEEDLDAIRTIDGVADAEGSTETVAWLPFEAGKLEVSVLAMPERISVPEILEGAAPQAAEECMVEKGLAEKLGLGIGDRIRLEGKTGGEAALMTAADFKVCGVFSHPDHVTDKVTYDYDVIVSEEVFDSELLDGCFPRARVTLSDMPENYFSKGYRKQVKPVEEALKELSATRSPLRSEEVRETYETRIADGEAELNEAKATLAEAEQRLNEGEAELKDVEAQIADGEKQIADAEQELLDAEAQIADGEKTLKEKEQELLDAEAQIADGEKQIAEAEQELKDAEAQITDGEKTLKEKEQELFDAEAQIADGEKTLKEKEQELLDAEAQISDGEKTLKEKEQELLDAEAQIVDGEKQIAEAEQELKDAEAQIADGEKTLKEKEKELKDAEAEIADGEKKIAEADLEIAEADQKLKDAERQIDDAEKELREAEKDSEEYEKKLEEGRKSLAEAERLLGLAPGELAVGEKKLRDAEVQLADGKEKLDEGRETLDEAEEYIDKGYDWMVENDRVPTRSEIAIVKKTLEEEYGIDPSFAPDEFPENFLDWPEDKAIQWIKDNFGYSEKEEEYEKELKKYEDGLAEYQRGRIDYYYSGEQYLDGLTAYEKGRKALREGEALLQELRDARKTLNEKKEELAAGQAEFEEKRAELEEKRAELEDGKKQVAEARTELEAKRLELEDGKKQAADGRKELEEKRIELEDGKKQVADGRKELEEKRVELEDGKKQAADGRKELEEKRVELEDGKKQAAEARTELEEKRAELEDGKKQAAEARTELEEKRTELEDGKKQVADGRKELEEKRAELEDGKKQAADGRKELQEKRIELEDGKKQVADGRKELEEKRAELEDGKKQAAEARAELEEKRGEYDEGLKEYEEYRVKLDDARADLNQLEDGTWAVRNNRGDVSFVYCAENSGNLASLSGTFSLLFIIIAALVIYASVGRMVDEQAPLVGTTKALGLLRKEILSKYMIFGILGTLLGVVVGILVAYFILEPLVLNMYAPYYLLPRAPKRFLLVPTLIVVLGGLLLAILSVYFACNRLLKMPAVDLMKGADAKPKEKKEKKEKEEKKEKKKKKDDDEGNMIPGLILRNMGTDLKRVIVTIVSIMGCCVLLVVGFTLKYGEDRIVDRQFGKVMSYDAELEYAPETETAEAEIAGILDSMGTSHIQVQKSANAFTWDDELSGANLICAEPNSLPGYWNLTDIETKETLTLPSEGLVIPKRMHEYFGIEVGDTITVYDGNMRPHEAVVAGVFDNYSGRTVFVSPEAWRGIFGEDAEPNCFYVKLGDADAAQLNEAVKDTEGFLILTDAAAERVQIQETASALNVLIIVMIIIAGLMAFFILFNLSGSYMVHKQRELTVMRINGFTTKETKDYASTELIITSLAGILLGLPVGALLGYLVIRLTEGCDLQMVRSVDARSLIFSALITALFAAFINGLALRKIKNLNLSDI